MTTNTSYQEAMKEWRAKRVASMRRLREKNFSLARIGELHGGLSRQRVSKILKDAEQQKPPAPAPTVQRAATPAR